VLLVSNHLLFVNRVEFHVSPTVEVAKFRRTPCFTTVEVAKFRHAPCFIMVEVAKSYHAPCFTMAEVAKCHHAPCTECLFQLNPIISVFVCACPVECLPNEI
jgi:hypothetical protein